MSKTPATRPAPAPAPPPPPARPAADFPALLEKSRGEIAKILPEGMSVDRVSRIALTAYKLNPDIRDCDPVSILAAVMKCAELGLEPGGALKEAWLVPYQRQCQFQLSYFGALQLARRSGQFLSIAARLVHRNDHFVYEYAPDLVFAHRPALKDPGDVVGAYAYFKLANGESEVEYMTAAQVEEVRQFSRAGPVWKTYWGEMAKKTVLKRGLKRQPLSVVAREALHADDLVTGGAAPAAPPRAGSGGRGPAGLAARLADLPQPPAAEDQPQLMPAYEAESQEAPDPADYNGGGEEQDREPGMEG